MSPQKSLSAVRPVSEGITEIKLEDIDFESIKDCTDKAVIKRYLKLLEDDGNYFIELINACKDRLLEVSPKEYYLLYPRATSIDTKCLSGARPGGRGDPARKRTPTLKKYSVFERDFAEDASVKVDPIEGKGNWLQHLGLSLEEEDEDEDEDKEGDDDDDDNSERQGLSRLAQACAVLGWVVKIPCLAVIATGMWQDEKSAAWCELGDDEQFETSWMYRFRWGKCDGISVHDAEICDDEQFETSWMYRFRWGKCDGISVHDAEICSCRFDLVSDCREEVTQCRYTDPNMGFANPITQLCEAGTIAVSAKNFSLFRSAFAGRAAGAGLHASMFVRRTPFAELVRVPSSGWWITSMPWAAQTGEDLKEQMRQQSKCLFDFVEQRQSKRFVIGVGLPLYYNSLVFLLILSVLLFLGAHFALDSDSQRLTQAKDCATSQLVRGGVCCSFGCLDRLDFCRFAAMLIMLAHAWFQLKHAKWFESQHLTMKDFALVLSGLPPEATDETQIATWQSASPDKSAACSAGEFELQSGETVRSVSIGYDVTSRWGEVEVLLDRHLAFADAEAQGDRLVRMLCLEKDGRGIVWEDPETGQRQVLDFGVPTPGLASFLAISIYVPYAEYVTSFLEEAGKFPQGFMMGLLGFLRPGWVIGGTCVNVAGFQTIEDENLFIFITFTIFCVAASAFNVYLTWYYTQDLWQHHTSSWFQRVKGFLLDTGGPVTTLRDLRRFGILIGMEGFAFEALQGDTTGNSNGCAMNVRRAFVSEGKSGREAERFLEPLPIGLAWDYQGHVTLPCIWAFFFYFFQRFMHLRVCKKMPLGSYAMDSMVLYFGWGLLLAELAVDIDPEGSGTFLRGCLSGHRAVYWSLLWALGVPWPLRFRGELDTQLNRYWLVRYKAVQWSVVGYIRYGAVWTGWSGPEKDPTWDRCQSCEDFCYNWLNVNPVYVLKSQYCADEFGLDPCVFYEPGPSERQFLTGGGLWLEFEGLGCIAPICFDEVCTDVASSLAKLEPLDPLDTTDLDVLTFWEGQACPSVWDGVASSKGFAGLPVGLGPMPCKDALQAWQESPTKAALASVPGDQDPMDVSDFMEPSPRNAAKPSTSSADKREGPPDVFDAPERSVLVASAPDAARDQPDAKREAPSDAFDPQQLSALVLALTLSVSLYIDMLRRLCLGARAASASEPPAVQHEAVPARCMLERLQGYSPAWANISNRYTDNSLCRPMRCSCAQRANACAARGPRDAAAPSVPTPVQHEAGPCDAAAPSEPTPVQHEAPENASQGLEQSCLVAKSGISIVRGDGTAWVGGDNPEGSYVEGPRDAAAPSEPTPVQHEAGPCDAAAPSEPTPVQREEYIVATHRKRKSSDGPLFVQRRSQPKKATRAPEVGELVKAQRAMRAMTAQEEEDAFRDILEWEANVKEPVGNRKHCALVGRGPPAMSSNATWFMDAAAQGGGTPAGTAKVITNGLMAQPEDVRPPWTKGRSEAEICEIVTQSICDLIAVLTCALKLLLADDDEASVVQWKAGRAQNDGSVSYGARWVRLRLWPARHGTGATGVLVTGCCGAH
ncbi:hypothetical protein AK812_SmicGene16670 [Symbiodinium microadriaticum]|uniref:Uncharacterized protein n=1 Tax=Symbiodinium microadriaticum TaxID=2951 RepID=A0A1Q9DZR1_SYMMI|nr:hypothetical protein AK812_SmicGene16670 [Symbiodinium microadriaticum]